MNDEIKIEKHPWTPYIPKNSRILILGTFPPKREKWSMEFYYPNKINDFWRIMGIIFHNNKDYFYDAQSKSFRLNDIKMLLNSRGIALGDTALEVRRLKDNASDKYLEIITPLPLPQTIEAMPQCLYVASTGEKAAQVISQLTNSPIPEMGKFTSAELPSGKRVSIYRMPSTSRAFPLAIEKKAGYYRKMFKAIGLI